MKKKKGKKRSDKTPPLFEVVREAKRSGRQTDENGGSMGNGRATRRASGARHTGRLQACRCTTNTVLCGDPITMPAKTSQNKSAKKKKEKCCSASHSVSTVLLRWHTKAKSIRERKPVPLRSVTPGFDARLIKEGTEGRRGHRQWVLKKEGLSCDRQIATNVIT